MSMGLLIDTDVWVLREQGINTALERWEHLGDVCMSSISASELLAGVERASLPHKRTWRSAMVEQLLAEIPVVDIGLREARIHSRVMAALPKGITIGAHDAWIAATAMAGGHALLTRNARDFEKFPGLHLEIWTPPTVS
jgi:tRNA(fMet)-specific endonuclease VapC